MMSLRLALCLFHLLCCLSLSANLSLRTNMQMAKKGDFLVAAQNKNFTLLHIYDKQNDTLIIEEITVPLARMAQRYSSWREWVRLGAPYHTSWILYAIKLSTGEIEDGFSVSQNGWLKFSRNDTFLPTLLNLQLAPILTQDRRKIGPPPNTGAPDWRKLWQPKMVVDGKTIPGVAFTAWRTRWPKDDSELSGKIIELYLPEETNKYPGYFPYWLQIRGSVAGKATVHIIESGAGLVSPAPPMPQRK